MGGNHWLLGSLYVILMFQAYICLDQDCKVQKDCGKGNGQICSGDTGKCVCDTPCFKEDKVAHACVPAGPCTEDAQCSSLGTQGYCAKVFRVPTNSSSCDCQCRGSSYTLKRYVKVPSL